MRFSRRGVHDIVRQSALFEEVLELARIEGVFNRGREAGANLGPVAVADGVNQEIPQRPAVELTSLPRTSKTWPPSALRASSSFSSRPS